MTKSFRAEDFKPPSWAWDDLDILPFAPHEAAGYVIGTRCFKAFAIVCGLPIFVGAYPSRAMACAAIVEAHHGDDL